MPRPPRTATMLVASAVCTALAVGVGVVVAPSPVPAVLEAGGTRMVSVDTSLTRQDATSRSGERAPADAPTAEAAETAENTAGTTSGTKARTRAGRSPKFTLVKAGKPLTLKPVPQPGDPFTFQIGTLNVLGSQHTRGSKRYAPGTTRTARAAGLFLSRGMDLLGLQEVQDDQLNVLYNQLGGFGIWPGRALGNNGVRLQIAYRTDLFELVETGSITTRFDFQARPIPYVLLRDRVTGGEFWMVNIHNSPRTQEADRDSATAAEIALFDRLRATGRPVLVTGDMNEKEEWFCKVAVGAGMVAANGGSGAGGCVLPPAPLRIDWIMGGGGVDFSGYVQDAASLAGITDHYFVHASVTVTPTEMVVPKG